MRRARLLWSAREPIGSWLSSILYIAVGPGYYPYDRNAANVRIHMTVFVGTGVFILNNEIIRYRPGTSIVIGPGALFGFKASSVSEFLQNICFLAPTRMS